MAPLRSLGNIRSAFDDFYARTGKDAAGPNVPPPNLVASGGNIDGLQPGNGYTYHVFTSSGSLVISAVNSSTDIEYLVAAGGGTGGTGESGGSGGGGGGAGGVVVNTQPITSTVTYPVTVGTNGVDSSFGSLLTTTRGGNGNPGSTNPHPQSGGPGGSGGGGANYTPPGAVATGGAGNTPPKSSPQTPQQGYPGGNGKFDNSSPGGGGGGAGGAGGNSPGGSNGGAGAPYSGFAATLFPTMPADWISSVGPTGLYGKGGDGGTPSEKPASVANTGNGGHGGHRGPSAGKAGAPGIVIVRYSTY